MKTYTYKEAISIVEKFMIESGIRWYCSKYCNGKCCKGCYTSDNACHKNEGRRLSCSIYTCNNKIRINDEAKDILREVQYKINGIICGKFNRNPYFYPLTDIIDKLKFPQNIFKPLTKINPFEIQKDIRESINKKHYEGYHGAQRGYTRD